MESFSFNTTPGIRFGSDFAITTAEEVSKKLGNNILFITDPGLKEIGLIEPIIRELKKYSHIEIFSEVEADPSIKTLELSVEIAKNSNTTGVIGFGGGSSMDVAKLCSLLLGSRT